MSFLGHIAKRVMLFIVINALIMFTLNILLSIFGVNNYLFNSRGAYGDLDVADLLAFSLIYGISASLISLAISRMMAKWMMGVQIIPEDVREPELQWLVRTVHQLAKRSGISKMPEVGIYNSPEVNAFATGPTRNRALVAVSSGIMQKMDREQLEGVLAHEVAHIVNGDMVTMTLVQGILNAFVIFFSRLLASIIAQNVKEEDRPAVHFFTRFVFEIAFTFLAMFIVAFYSRRREFRADAGSAKLVGREKMISALQALKQTSQMIDPRQSAVSSLKISGRSGILSLLSTHPPLDDRIRALQTSS